MTSHNEIQTLIAEIDSVLPKAGSGGTMPLTPADLARQHRVLEKLRSYLASLQHPPMMAAESPGDLTPTEQETARRIAQAVVTQLSSGRSDWMQPLRAEVEALKQQRESLVRELRQNEAQRQQQMVDFLKTVSDRIQTLIQDQLSQTLQQNALPEPTLATTSQDIPRETSGRLESPAQWDQLQHLQQESDRLLINLDVTLRTVFETLERDIQGYQRSLGQGLDKMHILGQQSEAIFSSYLNRLGEQMGLGKLIESEPQIPVNPPKDSATDEPSQMISPLSSSVSRSGATDLYPFPGMEWPSESPQDVASSENEASLGLSNPEREIASETGTLSQETQHENEESIAVTDEFPISPSEENVSQGADLATPGMNISDPWTDALFEEDIALTEEEISFPTQTDFPEAIETITSLMDLAEESYPVEAQPFNEGELEEESHSPVSPHEVLLSSDRSEVEDQENWEGYLDGERLDRLSEDLERFEMDASGLRRLQMNLELEDEEENSPD